MKMISLGVHMAYSLKQMGFTDVTIVERSNRIGGKGEHVEFRDIKHALTIIAWTSEYADTLVPLLTEYGFLNNGSNNIKGKSSLFPGTDDSVAPISSSEYLVGYVMQTYGLSDPNQALARIVQDISKYDDIHRELFGVYPFGIPRRPDTDTLQQITGTVVDFLTEHDLLSLVPLFQNAFHTTGFG